MKADDVTRSLDQALIKTGIPKENRPKLMSDNGSCYISGELKQYIKNAGMTDNLEKEKIVPKMGSSLVCLGQKFAQK